MIIVTRILLALILGIAGYQIGERSNLASRLPGYAEIALNFGVLIALGAVTGWLLGGVVGKLFERALSRMSERTADRSGSELVVGVMGLMVGLTIGALLALPILQLDPFGDYILLPITLAIAYGSAELAASRHREILQLFGFSEASSQSVSKLLDTSALIDGRVADVAFSGFLEGELVVPVYVLEELQHIADSDDPVRRARGRRGLAVVTKLRKRQRLVTIDDDPVGIAQVDSKLVKAASERGWVIVTNDVALQRVAQAQDVFTLNVNELANALKPEFVPGERIELLIVRNGKEAGQGVGYLEDGTMVVVDGGARAIDETVEVEVSSMLQSPTGKLVFARLDEVKTL